MKEEPGEHSGQGGYPVIPGDHKVDQVVVRLPALLPGLAPLEADLGGQVPALPRHTGLIGHLLGPVQPPEILWHRPRILVAMDKDDGQVPRHQEAVRADQGLGAIGCLHWPQGGLLTSLWGWGDGVTRGHSEAEETILKVRDH